jgi:hypothetical protein
MKRRQFVKASLASGTVMIGIGAGAYQLIVEESQDSLSIDFALTTLNKLSNEHFQTIGEWDLYQIFTHCAQSVEFSMSQFPEHKSDLFKSTVGKLAFSIFSSKGKMTHGLNEPIPSAPILTKGLDSMMALNRLKNSLIDFDSYQGTLAPHFAYGVLTKNEYEKAHLMHLYNHLEELKS